MTASVESDDMVSSVPDVAGRATRVLVDLDAIAGNVRYFRSLVSPRTAVMAVVKADGYGHGAVEVAREAIEAGARYLAVATVSEGVALRAAGLTASALVLGPIDPSELGQALEHDLALAVGDRHFADQIGRVASSLGRKRVPVHLKIDSGMRRYGALPKEALGIARRIVAHDSLLLQGVFTHFADADGASESTTVQQAAVFDAVRRALSDGGIRPPLVHAANSAAALRWRRYDYEMVRIGIALYGLSPAPGFPMPAALRPALRVVSKVARVIPLAAGDGVSYGHTYRSPGDARAALVPIGYADGYPRGLSNRGRMSVRGKPAPVLGRVCMDQTVIGLEGNEQVAVGEWVDVVGGDGPSLDEMASSLGTISFDVATGLARRMPRTYVRGIHSTNL